MRTITLAILFASAVSSTLVQAVDYNVGVRVGDWIKYGQFAFTWSGNGTEPEYVTASKNVDWLRIDFVNIDGTTVALNMTAHYNNGTLIPQNSSVDVTGGTGISGYILIASNLKDGDNVTNRANSPTINQTTTGIYAGAIRNVNLLETTSIYNNQTTTIRMRWDQSTGTTVEMYEKIPDYNTPGAYSEFSIRATETNMWSPDLVGILSNNLIYIITGILVIIIIVGVVIFLRRKKPPSPQQPLPEPPARARAPGLLACLPCNLTSYPSSPFEDADLRLHTR